MTRGPARKMKISSKTSLELPTGNTYDALEKSGLDSHQNKLKQNMMVSYNVQARKSAASLPLKP
jgi:hypothetical protein